MYSRLIDCSPSEVKIGQAVRVSFQILRKKMLPFLKLEKSSRAHRISGT